MDEVILEGKWNAQYNYVAYKRSLDMATKLGKGDHIGPIIYPTYRGEHLGVKTQFDNLKRQDPNLSRVVYYPTTENDWAEVEAFLKAAK